MTSYGHHGVSNYHRFDCFLKENTWVGWCEEGVHSLASGGGFRRLVPASDLPTRTTRRAGVLLLHRTYSASLKKTKWNFRSDSLDNGVGNFESVSKSWRHHDILSRHNICTHWHAFFYRWCWFELKTALLLILCFTSLVSCHVSWLKAWTPLTHYGDTHMDQHLFRQWLVAWRHQVINWTNIDLSSVRSSDIHLRAVSPQLLIIEFG